MAWIEVPPPPEGFMEKGKDFDIFMPVRGTFTSGYDRPRSGGARLHHAGDISAPAGETVYAPADMEFVAGGQGGTNLRSNDWWSWWRDPESGREYRFAHHGPIKFEPGHKVSKGQPWSEVGNAIQGTHLHMAVREGGEPIDWPSRLGLEQGARMQPDEDILAKVGRFLGPSSAEAAEVPPPPAGFKQVAPPPPGFKEVSAPPEVPDPPTSVERRLAGTAADVLGFELPIIGMSPAQLGAVGAGRATGLALTRTGAGMVAMGGLAYGLEEKGMRALKEFAGRPVTPANQDQFAKDFASGAITTYAGMVGEEAMKPLVQPFAKMTYDWAKGIYEHVLKVPTTVPAEMRDKAVQSAMEGYIAVTKKGLQKLTEKLQAYHAQVAGIVDESAAGGATIERNKLIEGLHKLKERYRRAETFTESEINTITDMQTKIIKAYPERIPVDQAQGMKQELYQLYQDAYKNANVMKSVDKNMGKTVAKEIMIELENNIPGLAEINKKWGGNLELLKHLERAVNRTRNYETFRLGDIVMTAGQGPEAGLLNRIVNNPTVISHLALILGQSRKATGEMIGRITGYGLTSHTREELEKGQPEGVPLPPSRDLTGPESKKGFSILNQQP